MPKESETSETVAVYLDREVVLAVNKEIGKLMAESGKKRSFSNVVEECLNTWLAARGLAARK